MTSMRKNTHTHPTFRTLDTKPFLRLHKTIWKIESKNELHNNIDLEKQIQLLLEKKIPGIQDLFVEFSQQFWYTCTREELTQDNDFKTQFSLYIYNLYTQWYIYTDTHQSQEWLKNWKVLYSIFAYHKHKSATYNSTWDIFHALVEQKLSYQWEENEQIQEKLDQVHKALEIIQEHFLDQTRKNKNYFGQELYYSAHIKWTTLNYICTATPLDIDWVIIRLLHDTIEDTNLTFEDIQKGFWTKIAIAVDFLTKKEPNEDDLDKERYKKTDIYKQLASETPPIDMGKQKNYFSLYTSNRKKDVSEEIETEEQRKKRNIWKTIYKKVQREKYYKRLEDVWNTIDDEGNFHFNSKWEKIAKKELKYNTPEDHVSINYWELLEAKLHDQINNASSMHWFSSKKIARKIAEMKRILILVKKHKPGSPAIAAAEYRIDFWHEEVQYELYDQISTSVIKDELWKSRKSPKTSLQAGAKKLYDLLNKEENGYGLRILERILISEIKKYILEHPEEFTSTDASIIYKKTLPAKRIHRIWWRIRYIKKRSIATIIKKIIRILQRKESFFRSVSTMHHHVEANLTQEYVVFNRDFLNFLNTHVPRYIEVIAQWYVSYIDHIHSDESQELSKESYSSKLYEYLQSVLKLLYVVEDNISPEEFLSILSSKDSILKSSSLKNVTDNTIEKLQIANPELTKIYRSIVIRYLRKDKNSVEYDTPEIAKMLQQYIVNALLDCFKIYLYWVESPTYNQEQLEVIQNKILKTFDRINILQKNNIAFTGKTLTWWNLQQKSQELFKGYKVLDNLWIKTDCKNLHELCKEYLEKKLKYKKGSNNTVLEEYRDIALKKFIEFYEIVCWINTRWEDQKLQTLEQYINQVTNYWILENNDLMERANNSKSSVIPWLLNKLKKKKLDSWKIPISVHTRLTNQQVRDFETYKNELDHELLYPQKNTQNLYFKDTKWENNTFSSIKELYTFPKDTNTSQEEHGKQIYEHIKEYLEVCAFLLKWWKTNTIHSRWYENKITFLEEQWIRQNDTRNQTWQSNLYYLEKFLEQASTRTEHITSLQPILEEQRIYLDNNFTGENEKAKNFVEYMKQNLSQGSKVRAKRGPPKNINRYLEKSFWKYGWWYEQNTDLTRMSIIVDGWIDNMQQAMTNFISYCQENNDTLGIQKIPILDGTGDITQDKAEKWTWYRDMKLFIQVNGEPIEVQFHYTPYYDAKHGTWERENKTFSKDMAIKAKEQWHALSVEELKLMERSIETINQERPKWEKRTLPTWLYQLGNMQEIWTTCEEQYIFWDFWYALWREVKKHWALWENLLPKIESFEKYIYDEVWKKISAPYIY